MIRFTALVAVFIPLAAPAQTLKNAKIIGPVVPGYFSSIIADGDILYGAWDYLMTTIDISDPEHPVILDTCDWWVSTNHHGDMCEGMALHYPYLYAGSQNQGVVVFDVTDPRNVSKIGNVLPRGKGSAYIANIFTWEHYIYAFRLDSMFVFDVTNPALPVQVSEYGIYSRFPSGSHSEPPVFIDGNKMFTESLDTLRLFQLNPNGSVELIRTYEDIENRITCISRKGDSLFVGRSYDVEIYQIDSSYNLVYVSRIASEMAFPTVFCFRDKYMFILYDTYGYIVIYDISDLASPTEVVKFGSTRWMYFYDMVVRGDYVFFTSTTEGFMLAKIDSTQVGVSEIHAPSSLSLSPIYPNPVISSASMEYSLPSQQYVTLELYNALGQKMQTLYSGIQDPGSHTARLDAAGLPAGLYRCVLRSGGGVATQAVAVRK